jgi:hypothetical protein
MSAVRAIVENNNRKWMVRLWVGRTGRVIWDFKDEAEARRLAMNINETVQPPSPPTQKDTI